MEVLDGGAICKPWMFASRNFLWCVVEPETSQKSNLLTTLLSINPLTFCIHLRLIYIHDICFVFGPCIMFTRLGKMQNIPGMVKNCIKNVNFLQIFRIFWKKNTKISILMVNFISKLQIFPSKSKISREWDSQIPHFVHAWKSYVYLL